jgi:hypothetical protein
MERKNILRLIVVFFVFLPGLLMIGSHLEGDGDGTVNGSAVADRDSST